jgi:hypothetical protein
MVFFAAWLRISYQSPCEWLWEAPKVKREEGPSNFIPTLGFWLWMAGAEIPVVWEGLEDAQLTENATVLPPLQWYNSDDDFDRFDEFDDLDESFDSDVDYEECWQDLAGHLRREAHSHQTQRSLRRGTQRKVPSKACCEKNARHGCFKANRTLY